MQARLSAEAHQKFLSQQLADSREREFNASLEDHAARADIEELERSVFALRVRNSRCRFVCRVFESRCAFTPLTLYCLCLQEELEAALSGKRRVEAELRAALQLQQQANGAPRPPAVIAAAALALTYASEAHISAAD